MCHCAFASVPVAACVCPWPSSCRHRGTEETTTQPERPFDTQSWVDHEEVRPLQVSVVYWDSAVGGTQMGYLTTLPCSPLCCAPPQLSTPSTVGGSDAIDGQVTVRPVSAPPPHHPPSQTITHPSHHPTSPPPKHLWEGEKGCMMRQHQCRAQSWFSPK